MLARLLVVCWIIARYRLDKLLPKTPWSLPARQLLWLFPARWVPKRGGRGLRIRKSLEAIGPIAVKFGQALSTRRDLLAEDIAVELAKLQDRAPPFSGKLARQIARDALGGKLHSAFARFELKPLASASIAQIHPATLHSGESVVVKILRPDIHRQVERDLRLLESMAGLVDRLAPQLRRLKPREIVTEYAQAVREELDLRVEAANTSRLRKNFENSPLLYVPKVYWDYVHENVMVMERIEGIPVDDSDGIDKAGLNRKHLAETGVRIFFTQVFRDNFFHADMHPGNVYLSTKNPDRPNYIALDCAVMASLSERELYCLARILLAIFQQNYQLVAELQMRFGWVPRNTRIDELARALSAVCSPIFDRPLGEISLGKLLLQLFSTAKRFDMRMQPELILLQKTLLQIEGLGRQLYPMLDLWSIGRPFLQRWLRRRYSPNNLYRLGQREIPLILASLPRVSDYLAQWQDNMQHGPETGTQREMKRLLVMQSRWMFAMLAVCLGCVLVLGFLLLKLI